MTSWESISHHRQRGRNSPLSPSRASRKFSSCVSPYRQAHSPEISEFLSLGKLSGCSELGLAASRTSSCSVSVTFGSASTKSSSFFFFFFFFFFPFAVFQHQDTLRQDSEDKYKYLSLLCVELSSMLLTPSANPPSSRSIES